jgi:2',3'-cyclic-nucleotide 2'-phosphodiesterase (5'-nucleotidase family)
MILEKKRGVIQFTGLGFLSFAFVIVLAACSTPAPTATPSPTPTPVPILKPEPFSLTLLYTNDSWGYTEPCACDPSAGGLARRATFIKSVREQRENVLLLDSGDSLLNIQRIGDLEQAKLLVQAFNELGYDAMALGGMDFRMGFDVLREQIAVAHFPILSINALDPQTQQFFDRDYVTIDMYGHRIALIGLTDTKMARDVTEGQVLLLEPIQSIVDLIEEIKDEADIIIVLSHLGAKFDLNLGLMASGIDVVVSGLDKQIYTAPVETNDYLIVSAGSRGEFIGQLDLDFDAQGNVVSFDMHLQHLLEEIPDDPEMRQWLATSGLISSTALKPSEGGVFSP